MCKVQKKRKFLFPFSSFAFGSFYLVVSKILQDACIVQHTHTLTSQLMLIYLLKIILHGPRSCIYPFTVSFQYLLLASARMLSFSGTIWLLVDAFFSMKITQESAAAAASVLASFTLTIWLCSRNQLIFRTMMS